MERGTPPHTWRSFKLMFDPALTKGLYKVYRYDGRHFNIPVEDLPVGLLPVDRVRDPRICRLRSKSNKSDLLVSKFKVDEWYVGTVPPKEVTISKLNDNVREAFLTNMCKKYGNAEEVEVFYNPKNKKHLGIAKVVFDTVRAAKDAVQGLHQTSVMGNVIHVEIDPRGANRTRYLQLLLSGYYTPWTLPVGSNERTLQSLIDSLLSSEATQLQASVSSPIIATPLSLDTAYSSIYQDTPCSFGMTPRSQGTPHTPCFSATPLSQDSCYSSLQATPVLQAEPSASSVHRPLRGELCHRKPVRHQRGSCEVTDVSLILKQPQPLRSLATQTNRDQLAPWDHNAQTSAHSSREAYFNQASPCQESRDVVTTTSNMNFSTFSILSINFTAASMPAGEHARITELSPASRSPQPEVESLDSRIESLLINSQNTDPSYFNSEADILPRDSPTSPCLAYSSPLSGDLIENEEDETPQAVLPLMRQPQPPAPSDVTHFERTSQANSENDAETFLSLPCLKEHCGTNEDKEESADGAFAALSPTKEISSLPHPPPFSSLDSTTQLLISKAPLAIRPQSQPPVASFPYPIPPFLPAIPPVPPRLPNGTIPIPPPGWIPPPGHQIPIPPPPTFIGPPPSLTLPPPVHPLSIQPPGSLDKGPPLPFLSPHLPAPPFPRFNPFMPPPDYRLVRENLHKVTVEKVLEVIVDELKLIIKKDITRRMIEGTAFKAFEDWWNCEEKKTKFQVSHLKSGGTSVEKGSKLINPLSHTRGEGKKPPLPSFKVKRKRASDPAASEGIDDVPCSTHEIISSDVKEEDDGFKPASEGAKRRHARPHELESDDDGDDEGKEEDNTIQEEDDTIQEEETVSEKVEAAMTVDDDPQILCDADDDDADASEDEKETVKTHTNDEFAVNQTSDEVEHLDSETFTGSSSSEDAEYSSDFDSSDSFASDSFEDSSCFDLSPENEDTAEDEEDNRVPDYIVLSSDDELMEQEPPTTPSTPSTPGGELDLNLQEWSASFHREEAEENPHTSYQQELDSIMELQTSQFQDHPQLLSLHELTAVAPHLDVEMESPDWLLTSLKSPGMLRPITPTGSLVDDDPDLLMRSKPTSSAVEEMERPQTPGKGIVAELDSEDSPEDTLSLSPTRSALILAPSDPLTSLHQERPTTPGREVRSGWSQSNSDSVKAPATPGRNTNLTGGSIEIWSALSSPPPVPCLSGNSYITAPKTPGRDIILPRRDIVHRRKVPYSQPLLCDSLTASPASESASWRLSESSCDSADGRSTWISPGVRMKPLQGLENMPGLLDEESRRETEKFSLRRKKLRRLKRKRWRIHQRLRVLKRTAGSHSFHSHPQRRRSPCEKRRILHKVWKEGLDEEDARLLQCTYDRLQEQDNGCGWISNTLWIPHPLTKVLRDKSEELKSCLPQHRTGSARSEGFYRISQKDKLRYLNNTKLTTELPSPTTQGTGLPLHQSTSLRSGSDFRSDQRRLRSLFNCDSELVKFNQLQFRKKRIRFSRSYIHEWGLFAMEPIAADEMVIEYVGQLIRQVIADMKEHQYEEEGIGSSYLFRIDQDTIIDATKCGNLARFINHSCNPNCYAKIITVESQKKIVIYSRQPIGINEEITYDYKFPIEETKIPCLCGADGCRGSLN